MVSDVAVDENIAVGGYGSDYGNQPKVVIVESKIESASEATSDATASVNSPIPIGSTVKANVGADAVLIAEPKEPRTAKGLDFLPFPAPSCPFRMGKSAKVGVRVG
jgi:hypothetical protein